MKKNKKITDSLFLKTLSYIRESKNYIFFAIYLFLFFALVGFFVPPADSIVEQIKKIIEDLISQTENLGTLELIFFILKNNVQASFLALLAGIFFAIWPLVSLISNGYILGFVAKLSVSQEGIFVLWRLLPHGIFELPAVFLSFGLGIRLGIEFFKVLFFKKYSWKKFAHNLYSFLAFLFVILPLLIIAAIIEGILIKFIG